MPFAQIFALYFVQNRKSLIKIDENLSFLYTVCCILSAMEYYIGRNFQYLRYDVINFGDIHERLVMNDSFQIYLSRSKLSH